jgi:hypothetical protein
VSVAAIVGFALITGAAALAWEAVSSQQKMMSTSAALRRGKRGSMKDLGTLAPPGEAAKRWSCTYRLDRVDP